MATTGLQKGIKKGAFLRRMQYIGGVDYAYAEVLHVRKAYVEVKMIYPESFNGLEMDLPRSKTGGISRDWELVLTEPPSVVEKVHAKTWDEVMGHASYHHELNGHTIVGVSDFLSASLKCHDCGATWHFSLLRLSAEGPYFLKEALRTVPGCQLMADLAMKIHLPKPADTPIVENAWDHVLKAEHF